MIEAHDQIFRRKVEHVVSELKYVNSASFLRGLDLKTRGTLALEHLREIFPVSTNSPSNANEFGQHLIEGWKVSNYVTSATIGFKIKHDLWNFKRARTILRSLDTGSKEFTYTASNTFSFIAQFKAFGKKGRRLKDVMRWVTIRAGQEVHRPAREGVFYKSKTEAFIRTLLLPELKADAVTKIKRRLKRVK